MEEMFGLRGLNRTTMQLSVPENPLSINNLDKLSSEVEEDLIFFLQEFIYKVIEEMKH